MTQSPTDLAANALRDEAVAWLVRVQSDAATGEDWSALTDWLEASEAHLAAFEAAEQAASDIVAHAGEIADLLPQADPKVIAFRPRTASGPARRSMVAALVAAAACLVAVPLLWSAYQGTETTYRTAIGETRNLALADGTQIRMGAASTLSVRLGWRARRVTMASAEATFDVAKDPGRPFLISVGDQQVRVVGTEFNIRHYDRQVTVTVRRGVVEVRQQGLGADPVARLTPGQELRHAEGARTSIQAAVNPERAFAWTEGRLVIEDRPLPEIVADLNRRFATPIRLSPAAVGRRFSGVLDLRDQDGLVRRLADYLSLPTHRDAREITLG